MSSRQRRRLKCHDVRDSCLGEAVTVGRDVDAPRALVWWTLLDPEQLVPTGRPGAPPCPSPASRSSPGSAAASRTPWSTKTARSTGCRCTFLDAVAPGGSPSASRPRASCRRPSSLSWARDGRGWSCGRSTCRSSIAVPRPWRASRPALTGWPPTWRPSSLQGRGHVDRRLAVHHVGQLGHEHRQQGRQAQGAAEAGRAGALLGRRISWPSA